MRRVWSLAGPVLLIWANMTGTAQVQPCTPPVGEHDLAHCAHVRSSTQLARSLTLPTLLSVRSDVHTARDVHLDVHSIALSLATYTWTQPAPQPRYARHRATFVLTHGHCSDLLRYPPRPRGLSTAFRCKTPQSMSHDTTITYGIPTQRYHANQSLQLEELLRILPAYSHARTPHHRPPSQPVPTLPYTVTRDSNDASQARTAMSVMCMARLVCVPSTQPLQQSAAQQLDGASVGVCALVRIGRAALVARPPITGLA